MNSIGSIVHESKKIQASPGKLTQTILVKEVSREATGCFHYRELVQADFIFFDADVTVGGAHAVGREGVLLEGDLDDRQWLEGNIRRRRRRRR